MAEGGETRGNTGPRKESHSSITGLPVLDPREWQGKAIPQRLWFVEGFIPQRTVTIFSGAGGSGKTEIALQLVVSAALGTKWFGRDVGVGPCLLLRRGGRG
jgi:RecA-family ATPase